MALERQNYPEGYFPVSEYHARWKKIHKEMKKRKYDIAIIWGKTAGHYERALETLWLTNSAGPRVFTRVLGLGCSVSRTRLRNVSSPL